MSPSSSNERLEFLGDAVLEISVSDYLYRSYPSMSEGEMTKLRAAVVCESALSVQARKIGIGNMLKMGKGEDQTGGRERDSILSDAFEALIGAIYLDGGLESARKFVIENLKVDIDSQKNNFWENDPKTYLQEQIQKNSREPLEYSVVDEKGPDHDKLFLVELRHCGKLISKGQGKSKKDAEQNAAWEAVQKLGFS